MPSCRYCEFDPADYGHDRTASVKLGNYGAHISLLTCERCGADTCSSCGGTGSPLGFGEWEGKFLCNACSAAAGEEDARRWDSEFGDSGLPNPYR